MPYVSHPVRRMRDDPVPDEPVDLLVRVADDADQATVAAALAELAVDPDGQTEQDGEERPDGQTETPEDDEEPDGQEGPVEDRGLGALAVRVPQAAVADVCDLEGLAAVETTNTLAMDLDGAGEDVEY